MVDQKLMDFISQQLKAGTPDLKIRDQLRQEGWQPQVIADAFFALNPVHQEIQSAPEKKSFYQSNIALILGGLLVLLVSMGATYAASGFYFSSQKKVLSTSTELPILPINTVQPTTKPTVQPALEQASQEAVVKDEILNSTENKDQLNIVYDDLPDDNTDSDKELVASVMKVLATCTPEVIEFTHPFDGQTHIKEIVGQEDDKCHYKESLPNNGQMDCYFSQAQLKDLSEYTDSFLKAKNIKIAVNSNLDETISTELHDGIEIINPWNVAFEDQTCKFYGY